MAHHITMTKDVLVDFESPVVTNKENVWLFNVENKIVMICYIYKNPSTGINEYQNYGQYCFAEFPEGIYYWDTQNPRWAIFDEVTQKAYSDYTAEKAILGR